MQQIEIAAHSVWCQKGNCFGKRAVQFETVPVWSRETRIQWLRLSVTSLLRVKPKMHEDKRFELIISRRPRLARLFEGLEWFLFTKLAKMTEILESWNISCLWLSGIIINGLWVCDLWEIYYKALEVCKVIIYEMN